MQKYMLSAICNGWELLDTKEKGEAKRLLFIVLFAAVLNATMIGSIWPFLEIISNPEEILENENYSRVYSFIGFSSLKFFAIAAALFALFIILLSTIVQIYRVFAVSKFSLMRFHSLGYKLFHLYLMKPYEFHTLNNSSDLEAHLLSETQHVVQQLYRPAANVVSSLASVLAMLILLLFVNLTVSLIVFCVFGLFYSGIIFFTRKAIRELGNTRHKENKKCFNIVSEAFSGIKAVKASMLEDTYLSKFDRSAKQVSESQVKAQVLGESPNFLLQGITFGGMILFTLLILDLDSVLTGSFGKIVPLLGIYAFAGQRLIPELQRLYQGYTQFQYANKAVDTIRDAFYLGGSAHSFPGHDQNTSNDIEKKNLDVNFESVSYKFPGAEKNSISNISFRVPFGTKVGIVGATGAGKTTLVDLLLGLLEPTDGAIKVGSQHLDRQHKKEWLSLCSYLPQDVFLIDGSIKDNILFGSDTKVDLNILEWALDTAALKNVIETKDDGIDSEVGEKGVLLSGGQRQRIGIARTLYRRSPVIVFDEATSALDTETERIVLEKLYNGVVKSTVFVIAHRLSSIKSCDHILVLNNGELVGQGDWDSLYEDNKWFKNLVIAGK